jgi:hypothetical protein
MPSLVSVAYGHETHTRTAPGPFYGGAAGQLIGIIRMRSDHHYSQIFVFHLSPPVFRRSRFHRFGKKIDRVKVLLKILFGIARHPRGHQERLHGERRQRGCCERILREGIRQRRP